MTQFLGLDQDGNLVLNNGLIWGLVSAVVFSPKNKTEAIPDQYWLQVGMFRMFISELWGRIDLAKKFVKFHTGVDVSQFAPASSREVLRESPRSPLTSTLGHLAPSSKFRKSPMTEITALLKYVEEHKVSLALIGSLLANIFLAMKWIVERRDKKEVIYRIRPTFVSLFGRYVLENINVYTRTEHGELIGRTINDIPERDTYFKVQPVIRGLVYRIVPNRRDDRLIVFMRRSPYDQRRLVNFNIVS